MNKFAHSKNQGTMNTLQIHQKTALCLLAFLVFNVWAIAQITTKPYINPGNPASAITNPPWIEIYTTANLAGTKYEFRGNRTNIELPNSNLYSFRVQPGYIAYLTNCNNDLQTEEIYRGEVSNYNKKICNIRFAAIADAYVSFHGISTPIHNNDCRRVFGSVKVSVQERTPSGQILPCPMSYHHGRGVPAGLFEATIYQNANANTTSFQNQYVQNFDGRVIPTLDQFTYLAAGRTEIAGATFIVSEAALRENRVFVTVTTMLGSAHKSHDLASDFSSNIRMPAPIIHRMGYHEFNGRNSTVALGPYQAVGSPDSNIAASGGIYKQFRVHLSKLRNIR
jgi:hypothetical protein